MKTLESAIVRGLREVTVLRKDYLETCRDIISLLRRLGQTKVHPIFREALERTEAALVAIKLELLDEESAFDSRETAHRISGCVRELMYEAACEKFVYEPNFGPQWLEDLRFFSDMDISSLAGIGSHPLELILTRRGVRISPVRRERCA